MRRRRDKGFSLLEVLVALAVASLALGVLFQSSSVIVRALAKSEEALTSVLVAQNLLAGLGTGHPIAPGTIQGRTDEDISWRLSIKSAPGSPSLEGDGRSWVELLQVEVEVKAGGVAGVPFRLSTLRMRPVEAKQ